MDADVSLREKIAGILYGEVKYDPWGYAMDGIDERDLEVVIDKIMKEIEKVKIGKQLNGRASGC